MRRPVMLFFIAALPLLGADSADLFVAIRNGDHAAVQNLLRAGVAVNVKDAGGTTALMHSVLESDLAMMNLLLDAGAEVNTANSQDSTALMYAAVNLEKTRLLLGRGADVNVKGKGGATPMSVAVTTFGSTPVLKLLAAKGAKPESRLMVGAALVGDLEAIRYLLSIGVSPGQADSRTVFAAIVARCDACVRLLVEKGAPVNGARREGEGVLNETAKRAMPELSQFLLDHGASLNAKDHEGFTLLMQAVLSMDPPAARDRMVEWLLKSGVDPNAKNERGDTAYLLAARMGSPSTLPLLVKAGAKELREDWPKPAGSPDARTAVQKILPVIEMSGEAVFKSRGCISCHNNSLAAMTVALARRKGFAVNEEQAKKELGFAVATDKPYFEPMRLGSTIGGAATTIGYTLMGMAAAGYPADAETDAHVHYLSTQQFPDGSWRLTSYRPPAEYSPFTTTAVALRGLKLYPIPGRREEFQDRYERAKKWLLTAKADSGEERSMQLLGLAYAGATVSERAPFVKALAGSQNADGSWSVYPGSPGEAYATGEALYALHIGGELPISDPVYANGAEWLLRNQLSDGSWFMPTRAVPVQPHTFESGFPHGWHQFASDAASSWAAMALLLTLPDSGVTHGN
ncbi:MAG: ankyrin repeat domain-containing protein [Acidobacteriia bacterium]|nr:ankyrin repeat domain-containing protein [Terriglobia bacterium]